MPIMPPNFWTEMGTAVVAVVCKRDSSWRFKPKPARLVLNFPP